MASVIEGRELKLLRGKALAEKLGVSLETVRKIRMTERGFPKPRQVSGEVYGWLSSEVDEWLESRPVADRPY